MRKKMDGGIEEEIERQMDKNTKRIIREKEGEKG